MKRILKLVALVGISALAVNQASAALNLVVNGDFEQGDNFFTSGYGSVTGIGGGLAVGGEDGGGAGLYAVGRNANFYHSAFTTAPDHTLANGTGNMMILNGSSFPNKNVWTGQLSPGMTAGVTYLFSAWVMNVYHDNDPNHQDAELQFSIGGNPLLGTVTATGLGIWTHYTASYTPTMGGEIPTAVDLKLNGYANDFALDDLSLTAVPEPSTIIAGAMLLLPFGASTLRVIRRRSVA